MPERNVTTAIWTDPDFLSLSWIARYLLLHLETSTVPMSGIRYFRVSEATHAMGLPEEKVLGAVKALSGTKWAQHDPVTGEIWIKGFAGRQARGPDVKKAALRSLDDVHSESLVAAFKEHYKPGTACLNSLSQHPVATACQDRLVAVVVAVGVAVAMAVTGRDRARDTNPRGSRSSTPRIRESRLGRVR